MYHRFRGLQPQPSEAVWTLLTWFLLPWFDVGLHKGRHRRLWLGRWTSLQTLDFLFERNNLGTEGDNMSIESLDRSSLLHNDRDELRP